ncbi:hypothetical protein ACFL7M_05840 [Thermodesulfobacteriota bacterium]
MTFKMMDIVDLEKTRFELKVRKGYRNWVSQFGENFESSTRLSHLSNKTLISLAQGRGNNSFYLYDLIMNLQDLGSGFEFNDLASKDKMLVMDRYIFLLDRIRFEYMKRLGWFDSYPGEEFTLVELIIKFDSLAPGMQAKPPVLSMDHPAYRKFCKMNLFEKEELIRKLVPKALKEIQDHSTTL